MKSALLKVTALSVVLGLGVLVVLQANRPMGDAASKESGGETAEEIQPAEPATDPDRPTARQGLLASSADADESPETLGDVEPDVVPADRKLAGSTRPVPRRPVTTAEKSSRLKSSRNDPDSSPEAELDSKLDKLLDEGDPDLPEETARLDSRTSRGTELRRPTGRRIVEEDEPEASEDGANAKFSRKSSTVPRRPSAGRGRAAVVADDNEDEDQFQSSQKSQFGRSRVVAGGLSLPDEELEAELSDGNRAGRTTASKRNPSEGSRRRTAEVVPAGQVEEVTEEGSTSSGEEPADSDSPSALGDELEDPDEEFQPRSAAAPTTRERARSRFVDDTEVTDDSESAGTGTEPPTAVSRRSSAAEEPDEAGFEGADEPGLVPTPRSPAESLRAADRSAARTDTSTDSEEEDSPRTSGALGDDEPIVSEESPEETEAPAPRSRTGMAADEEPEEEPVRAEPPVRPEPEVQRAPAIRKTPAVEPATDDDPLQIRRGATGTVSPTPSRGRDGVSRDTAEPTVDDEPQPIRRARPRLSIDKKAPETAVLGRPMVYEIVVKNSGLVAARGVVVEDVVPVGIRIEGSKPQAQLEGRRLSWRLGTVEAGATQTIAVRVTPQSEGTLSGVATVHFDNEDEGDSRTGPRLQVSIDAPKRVTVGQTVNVTFKVRNLGKTGASGVLIHDVLPAGLKHPSGDDLEYEIGDIPAGEVRQVSLQLTAAQAGQAVNRAVITADGAVSEETVVALDVVGPVLDVARTGVKKLLPGKRGRFTNTVTNATATPLKNVTLVETIPAGMDFLDASDGGNYDDRKRTVTWVLGPLDPKEARSVSISLNANGRGSLISVVRASDPAGASGEAVSTTQVVGQPALSIEVPDLPGALDVGQEVTAVIKVYNRGTDAATNTRVTVSLPGTLEVVSVDGPVKYQRSAATAGGRPRTELRFDPIRAIDVKKFGELKLNLRARSSGAGRLQVQAACDQIADPIRREDDLSVLAE